MEQPSFLTLPHWNAIGIFHHHGICLPLNALTTDSSCGIGEFLDLIPLLEWLKTTGFDVLQLLPLNDTRNDPSPYMGISSIALHPIYLSLSELPHAHKLPKKILSELKALNSLPRVSYHEVLKKKLSVLSTYVQHILPELKEEESFKSFVEKNRSWLAPYALFCTLKHVHHEKAWWDWDSPAQKKLDVCQKDTALAKELQFWQAVQYLCFSQFLRVREKANELGISILGDIPILINKDSADVYWHQDLFSFDKIVGAPPDMYNREGQSWGFPLFHWTNHKKAHFAWWKERLTTQEALYHMYRLDHIVGFFRLWAIHPGRPAKEGHFLPKTPPEWKRLGETILKTLVQTTSMLPIGEDLGDIPELVRASMHELGIPGMKVMRWERKWHHDQSFIPPRTYTPESLTTISTHDSATLDGWWQESPQEAMRMAQDFSLPYEKKISPGLRKKILELAHSSGSLFHVNLLNEYLALFPELSHENSTFDRINVPGTISLSNWTYRFKVPLEKITAHTGLRETMNHLSLNNLK